MEYAEFLIETKKFEQNQSDSSFWEDIERRSSVDAINPIYGIDNEESLFPNEYKFWNLNKITSDVSIIHQTSDMPGVNTPYWNIGMRYTSFGAHVEDSNLGSINMLLKGKQKIWYAIPESHAKSFADFVQQSETTSECNLIVRHKSTLVAPSTLQRQKIPFAKVLENYSCVCVCVLLNILKMYS